MVGFSCRTQFTVTIIFLIATVFPFQFITRYVLLSGLHKKDSGNLDWGSNKKLQMCKLIYTLHNFFVFAA